MDSDRFDQLARSLSTRASRRRSVAVPLARLVAALLLGTEPLTAQREKKRGRGKRRSDRQPGTEGKKGKRKKKKKAVQPVAPPIVAGCVPQCGDRTCGTDGCGG